MPAHYFFLMLEELKRLLLCSIQHEFLIRLYVPDSFYQNRKQPYHQNSLASVVDNMGIFHRRYVDIFRVQPLANRIDVVPLQILQIA